MFFPLVSWKSMAWPGARTAKGVSQRGQGGGDTGEEQPGCRPANVCPAQTPPRARAPLSPVDTLKKCHTAEHFTCPGDLLSLLREGN